MTAYTPPSAVNQRMQLLGKLIQAAREERGMAQTDLAERTGSSRPTIHRLESGRGSVAWATVMTACWVLGLPSDPDALDDKRKGELLAKGEMIHRVHSRRKVDDDF